MFAKGFFDSSKFQDGGCCRKKKFDLTPWVLRFTWKRWTSHRVLSICSAHLVYLIRFTFVQDIVCLGERKGIPAWRTTSTSQDSNRNILVHFSPRNFSSFPVKIDHLWFWPLVVDFPSIRTTLPRSIASVCISAAAALRLSGTIIVRKYRSAALL